MPQQPLIYRKGLDAQVLATVQGAPGGVTLLAIADRTGRHRIAVLWSLYRLRAAGSVQAVLTTSTRAARPGHGACATLRHLYMAERLRVGAGSPMPAAWLARPGDLAVVGRVVHRMR